ncbi:MAG: hypothetical protein HYT48_03625 [Candidatus Vogelbacteria bacterium]|nr:hypothetical protein [Candidatus Vogelbacteria bacterium]
MAWFLCSGTNNEFFSVAASGAAVAFIVASVFLAFLGFYVLGSGQTRGASALWEKEVYEVGPTFELNGKTVVALRAKDDDQDEFILYEFEEKPQLSSRFVQTARAEIGSKDNFVLDPFPPPSTAVAETQPVK